MTMYQPNAGAMSFQATIKVCLVVLSFLQVRITMFISTYLFQLVTLSASLASTKLIPAAVSGALSVCHGQTHLLTKLILAPLLERRSC